MGGAVGRASKEIGRGNNVQVVRKHTVLWNTPNEHPPVDGLLIAAVAVAVERRE